MTATTKPTTRTGTAQQQIERDYRWNLVVNALDGASFWLGMSFISAAVIIPLYVRHFTDNPLLIGMVPFIATAGFLLPQLFMANAVERAPRKKYFPVTLGFFLERVPIFLLAPTAYFLAKSRPVLALVGFFGLYTWNKVGTGLTVVGWQDMIAKIIPEEKRGRFFGITNFAGNGAGILGSLFVPVVLDRFVFPFGYVISFSIAGVLYLLSWIFLSLTREPPVDNQKPPVSQLDYFRSLPDVLRRDRNFRMFLLSKMVFSLSAMATGFLAVYAVQTWDLADARASVFTVALQIGLTVANLYFGFLSDRKGHKLSLEICMVLSILALILAFVAPSPWWFFPIFFLRGAVDAGVMISGISIVYEFTDAESRATYIGLANTIPGVVAAVAPLIGGGLAGAVSYRAMFLLAAVVGALAFLLLRFTVREPRHQRVA
jgi:MFS family permease